jgi:membrane protein implicated in regulation of membrane protease activity
MGTWYREILISLGLAGSVVTICIIGIAFGVLLSFKVDSGNASLAAAFAVGFVVVVLLLLRRWGNRRKAPQTRVK